MNVGGVRNVLDAAAKTPTQRRRHPWVIFASSREVYGNGVGEMLREDAPMAPLNVYARCKVAGERMVKAAAAAGVRAISVRLSTVYGAANDHADRVIPAFAGAALRGSPLTVQGRDVTLDPTHVSDVARGLARVAEGLDRDECSLDPVHFVSGRGVSLLELATLAGRISGGASRIDYAAPRTFDTSNFIGDPSGAAGRFDWRVSVGLDEGLSRLIVQLTESARQGAALANQTDISMAPQAKGTG